MTVNTIDITSGPYDGNDVTDEFEYEFRIESNTQVAVYERVGTAAPTLLTLTTDYTVAGVGDDQGGAITRVAGALPSGSKWYIRSNYAETQLTAFGSQGGFFPDVHEAAMDKITFLLQQIKDITERSIKLAIFDESAETADMTIPDLETRISQYLGFDASGNLITIAGVAGDVTVSSFMETLLDDATAAIARATLGAVGLTGAEDIAGPKTFTGLIAITSATPQYKFMETGASDDNKKWDFTVDGEQFRLRITNDVEDTTSIVFEVDRTGTTVDLFNILSTALRHNGSEVLSVAKMPSFKAYANATQTQVQPSTYKKMELNGEDFDTTDSYDSVTDYRFLPGIAGKYLLTASAGYLPVLTVGTKHKILIYKNGVAIAERIGSTTTATDEACLNISDVVDADGTDYFEIFLWHNDSAARNTNGTHDVSYFSGSRIS